jgi:cytosine/adenosine deaminase-related metal-dependent hydrolase
VASIHLGHIFHLAGAPLVTEAAAALVSIPDGALVVADDGTDRLGNFDAGNEADFVVVDPTRTPALQAAVTDGLRPGETTRDRTLFGVLMATGEASIAGTYVQGRRLSP